MASSIVQAILGPRLYRTRRPNEAEKYHQIKRLEALGDQIITSAQFMFSFSKWASPFIILYLYRHGYCTNPNNMVVVVRFMSGAAAIYLFAMVIRGFGRYMDSDYKLFQQHLTLATANPTPSNLRMLNCYDFEQWARPYDFDTSQTGVKRSNTGNLNKLTLSESTETNVTIVQKILHFPMLLMGYVFFNFIGRALVYPGATWLVNRMNRATLISYRAKLVEDDGAVRARVKTVDNNGIDTIFIDNRNKTQNGSTLVICCEGNCGYYEIGIICTPCEKGYSVLGWNHPGFGESSGYPSPVVEQHAMDAVIQYAIRGLQFLPQNIIIYSWSIGGYVATWAGMAYPDLKALIIDASFDHLLPLAVTRLPAFMDKFVRLCVRQFMNLNIAEQLVHYSGPVLLIRRTLDEVITTNSQGDLISNRGNNLLTHLLLHRYPNIIDRDALQEWLSFTSEEKQLQQRSRTDFKDVLDFVFEEDPNVDCQAYLKALSMPFPIREGKELSEEVKKIMTRYIASKYMIDFAATHCIPLPPAMFQQPKILHSQD